MALLRRFVVCSLVLIVRSAHAAASVHGGLNEDDVHQAPSATRYRRLPRVSRCESPFGPIPPLSAVIHSRRLKTESTIQSAEVESRVLDVVWSREDDSIVFLLTLGPAALIGGRVWRSTDSGLHFTEMTPVFAEALPEGTYGDEEAYGVVHVFVSPHNADRVFFQGAGRYHWISTDGGESVRAVETAGKTTGTDHVIKIHPRRDDWALAMVERELCDDPRFAFTSDCAKDLFLTTDLWGAQIWTNLTEGADGRIAAFVDFDWGINADNNDERSVLATVYRKAEDLKGPYVGWDSDVHFVTSSNFFETSDEKLVPCGSQFEVVAGVLFLAVSNACPVDTHGNPRNLTDSTKWLDGVTLYVSADYGRNFHESCIPAKLDQAGYTLLSTHDGDGAFLIVHHIQRRPDSGIQSMDLMSHLYASGRHSAVFTETLPRLHSDPYTRSADFGVVHGLPGAYIANQALDTHRQRDSGEFLTKVTYNGGVTWEQLPPPRDFVHPECNRCLSGQECTLHLLGASAWSGSTLAPSGVYSHASAPGVLMGDGAVRHPGNDDGQQCTWLSVDGGVSWRDVAVGVHIFEYGDYGGILVMARYTTEGPAKEVRFSLDEGHCWQSIPLKHAIRVENIRMEPDGQRPRFVIHGIACDKTEHPKCVDDAKSSTQRGVVYTLDLQKLLNLRQCQREDYTVWRPLDNKDSPCLLGASVRIEKRRRDSICLNGGDYVRREFSDEPCTCTEDDRMCDYGFDRGDNETCVPVNAGKLPNCQLIEDGIHVVKPDGKRLVHGDACHESIDQIASPEASPSSTLSVAEEREVDVKTRAPGGKKSGNGAWIAGLVVFGGVVLGSVGLLLYRQRWARGATFDGAESPTLTQSLRETASWIRNGFRRIHTPGDYGDSYFVQLN